MVLRKLAAGVAALAASAAVFHAPAMAQPPAPAWSTPLSTIINPARNTAKSAWEPYKTRTPTPSADQKLTDPVLKGAIDIHAHFGPDSYDRQWDAFEIARLAQAGAKLGSSLTTCSSCLLAGKYNWESRFRILARASL